MTNNMKEISLNEMEQVNGGYICYENGDYYGPFYVIINDDNGQAEDAFESLAAAEWFCGLRGYSTAIISWEKVCELRNRN